MKRDLKNITCTILAATSWGCKPPIPTSSKPIDYDGNMIVCPTLEGQHCPESADDFSMNLNTDAKTFYLSWKATKLGSDLQFSPKKCLLSSEGKPDLICESNPYSFTKSDLNQFVTFPVTISSTLQPGQYSLSISFTSDGRGVTVLKVINVSEK